MATTAETIKAQLGGKALFMLGASQLLASKDSLLFAIKGCKTINKIRITLAPDDTYTIQFWKISRAARSMNLVTEVVGIYADQIHEVIESKTGLYTRL